MPFGWHPKMKGLFHKNALNLVNKYQTFWILSFFEKHFSAYGVKKFRQKLNPHYFPPFCKNWPKRFSVKTDSLIHLSNKIKRFRRRKKVRPNLVNEFGTFLQLHLGNRYINLVKVSNKLKRKYIPSSIIKQTFSVDAAKI